jgi:UDP-N-acetylglucosamine--N-acetylmuramyl-(pentapeptide) pyrophosphoryl-undecaprenol N-acetylglucosamine transferase
LADAERRVRVLVAAGGTGGHLYPAIAVAAAIQTIAKGAEVTFVGTDRGLESRIVPAAGFPLELVRARPLRGGSLRSKLAGIQGLVLGLVDAVRIVRRLEPSVAMGLGAYVSGAVVLAAALKGTPALILEPNAEPGLANRWLAPFVDEAACAWEETRRYFGAKTVVTGNPVRPEFARVGPLRPQSRGEMRILVFGGSQGSLALNRAFVASLSHLVEDVRRLEITHQTGHRSLEEVRRAYSDAGVEARVLPYIEAMDQAYQSADLVVARAGATTCAELLCAGRPSILVPLPLAGGHQERNAELMAEAGAARFLRESELSPERLARELSKLLEAPEERERMAERARAKGRPDAAAAVARRLLDLAARREGSS